MKLQKFFEFKAKLNYHVSKSPDGIKGEVRFGDGLHGKGFYTAIDKSKLPFSGDSEVFLILTKKLFAENWRNNYRDKGFNDEIRTKKLLSQGYDTIKTGDYEIAIGSTKQVIKIGKETTYNDILKQATEYFGDEKNAIEYLKSKNIENSINENLSDYTIDENWYLYKNNKIQYCSNSKSDLTNYLARNKPELLTHFNLKEKSKKVYKGIIKLYRGIGHNTGNNFYSPDKNFALQFTRTGKESELIHKTIDSSLIYKHTPLPKGYGTEDPNFDKAIEIALSKGLNAIWVDEGINEPDSVFIINPDNKI